jgi:carbon starvation protein
MRNRGRSLGDIARDVVSPRARLLFLIVTFFLLTLAMGVFTRIIATLFTFVPADGRPHPEAHPEAVIPVIVLLGAAVLMGLSLYKWRLPFRWVTLGGILVSLAGLVWGHRVEVTGIAQQEWIWILLGYAFVASVLPVWLLLQPRDYLNSFQLYAGMILILGGLFAARPPIVAPAVNTAPSDLPPLFPFLFITVACGAVSGFHCLVSSGTTAKQIASARDAQPIGYGGMITEGMLAILAVLACTAGLASAEDWHRHYASWQQAGGLGPKIGAFVTGAGSIMAALGISERAAAAFAAVVVVSFALTTLDSATRLLRYNIEEIARSVGLRFLANRAVASLLAVAAIASFAMMRIGGKPAGIVLWELFGTTNQLLAGLALLTVSAWLAKLGRPAWATLFPTGLMFVVTLAAMAIKILEFHEQNAWLVLVLGLVLLVLALALAAEGVAVILRARRRSR